MNESARYSSPVSAPRPRGSRVVEAFSPKLGRRLQCFGRHAFDQWIRLESDPAVLTFCERPLTLDRDPDKLLIDFWVRYRDQEILLVISDEYPSSDNHSDNVALPIHTVPFAELAAARIWIANWERMLPCMIACRSFITDALIQAIIHYVSEPMQLSRIEREFGLGDPTLARAVVFSLLHRGQLQAPTLAAESLSYLTPFEPVGECR